MQDKPVVLVEEAGCRKREQMLACAQGSPGKRGVCLGHGVRAAILAVDLLRYDTRRPDRSARGRPIMTILLFKAAITALTVAALLLLAEWRGRRAAGLLAGLPTVTGPALFWLAIDQGPAFAVEASDGAVAAGAACAWFAVAYAGVSRQRAWPWALVAALAASLLAAPLLGQLASTTGGLLLLVLAVCAVCIRALDAPALHVWPAAALASRGLGRPVTRRVTLEVLQVAGVSGAVSALVSFGASHIAAFWVGWLSSPPLIAGLVAVQLHRAAGAGAVAVFLRGYVGGLIGRSAFAALFGALLARCGLFEAGAAALVLAAALGWLLAQGLSKSSDRVAPVQATDDRVRKLTVTTQDTAR
jgi:hypothetical protein